MSTHREPLAPTACPEPVDSPLIPSPSKDERLAQDRPVEGRAPSEPTRRDFLTASGMLVVGFSVAGVAGAHPLAAVMAADGPYPDPDFKQLDSWIVIREDNTATFYVGKTD